MPEEDDTAVTRIFAILWEAVKLFKRSDSFKSAAVNDKVVMLVKSAFPY